MIGITRRGPGIIRGRRGHGGNPQLAYPVEVLADSPSAYYRMADLQGTILTDSSGHGRNGTLSAGAINREQPSLLTRDANFSDGIALGLASDLGRETVSAAAWMDTDFFTLEAIVKPHILVGGENASAIAKNENGVLATTTYRMFLDSTGHLVGELHRNGVGANDYVGGTPALSVDTIAHYVLTYDGANFKAYVNGVLYGNVSAPGVTHKTPTQNLTFGALGGNLDKYHGWLDEVAIYDHALSATRIRAHYIASITGAS